MSDLERHPCRRVGDRSARADVQRPSRHAADDRLPRQSLRLRPPAGLGIRMVRRRLDGAPKPAKRVHGGGRHALVRPAIAVHRHGGRNRTCALPVSSRALSPLSYSMSNTRVRGPSRADLRILCTSVVPTKRAEELRSPLLTPPADNEVARNAGGPPRSTRKGPLTCTYLVAGAGFEPATFGL